MLITQEITLKMSSDERKNKKLSQFGLKEFFRSLGIRQKIVYGYGLAIGIAILGATAGKIIENSYKNVAKKQLNDSQELISLLNNLQGAVLQAHTQTPKLIPLLKEPIRLELEYSRFLEYIAAVNRLLYQTKSFLYTPISADINSTRMGEDRQKLKRSLQAYISSIKDYSNKLETLDKQIDSDNLKMEEIQSALLSNLKSQSRQIDLEINQVIGEMAILVTEIQDQEAKKAVQALDKAETVGNLILFITLLAAAAIAATLAIYTSSVIAYPIEVTTKVAQQVTEQSNFTLQAPVTTEDEVGQLTTSLNQLIQRVATYTQELKQAQTQLIQTEKMSSLGQMVAGIAHEINNPINFIYGNVEHSKIYVQDLLELVKLYQQKHSNAEIEEKVKEIDLEFIADDLPKILASMKIGADRIRQLVLSLRNFSRLDEAELKEVDLHEGIDNTLLILNNRLKDKVKLIKQYGNLPLIECHPAQLNQVFMNIISNAIDALLTTDKSNKQITIQTELATTTINPLQLNSVIVKISDNGSGIPLEIQTKIFDPFFTTKAVGAGTGLGLSICYQIIEKHGGKISLTSQVGEGTEFAIALPIKQSKQFKIQN